MHDFIFISNPFQKIINCSFFISQPNALTQPNVLPQRTPHRIHPAIVQQQAINHILYSNIHDVELFCQICYEKNIIGSDGLVNERALRSEFDNFKFYKNLKFDFSTVNKCD